LVRRLAGVDGFDGLAQVVGDGSRADTAVERSA